MKRATKRDYVLRGRWHDGTIRLCDRWPLFEAWRWELRLGRPVLLNPGAKILLRQAE